MQMINEEQQQQQLIAQEERAWKELVNEQRAQDRQEKCEARLQKWLDNYVQMQQQ